MDSNGKYEKLWQFISFIIQKGCRVLEVSTDEKFLDGNIQKIGVNNQKILLRAAAQGKPINIAQTLNGIVQQTVKVGDKFYIPDKNNVSIFSD